MIDVDYYNQKRGIYSPLLEHNGIVCGFWLCGQNYRNATNYFGAYPPSYLKRMHWLFPNVSSILHLCSGKVETGTWGISCREDTLDINPDLNPTYCGNAENLKEVIGRDTPFDLILSDPPYNQNHTIYQTKKMNKKNVIQNCAASLKDGAHLVWIDTIIPIWAKADGYRLRGTIGMVQSTNHQCRVITILEKDEGRRTR